MANIIENLAEKAVSLFKGFAQHRVETSAQIPEQTKRNALAFSAMRQARIALELRNTERPRAPVSGLPHGTPIARVSGHRSNYIGTRG